MGGTEPTEIGHQASSERITAGFERLDAMLGGGVFRGSSTLVTGVPGTSKTTLAGKFAEAACRRGERTLFVSFDEAAEQIARNLASVGIQFKAHVKSGLLRMYSARTEGISAEEHLIKLGSLIREYRPRCMVIDPLTAIAKASTLGAARTVANRLIYMVKDAGITLVVTALSEDRRSAGRIDRPADLDDRGYLDPSLLPGAGRRAQPRPHDRQVARHGALQPGARARPEQVGPTLTDVYSAGGDVLMGTLRWEKEAEESARRSGSARNSIRSAASCNLPKPGPTPRSRPCRWICRGSALSSPCTPMKTRCAAPPRANARASCAEGAARTRRPLPRKSGNGAAR